MDFGSTWSRIDVEILEATCTTMDGAVPTTSSSPLLGVLRLKGRAYRLQREGGREDEPCAWAQADYVMTQEEASTITSVFLLFWGDMLDQPTFLVLRPASADSQKFERLGIIRFSKGDRERNWEKILAHCRMEDNIVVV
ncbi:hypothetical protein ONZ43_g3479 [Nemania bipapillata]|uniref:Uncharacterized protein n=1 Tax=Nemania bipapillata TaxID=110536 RepID=A0ACC2IWX1_9PEZI|nr:hypothetical protein ONZ43_g3479 [Nemania bipapillata]